MKEKSYENVKTNLYYIMRGMGLTDDEVKKVFNDMEIIESEKEILEIGWSEFVNCVLKDALKEIRAKHSGKEYDAMSKELIDGIRDYEKMHTFREKFIHGVKKYMDTFGLNRKQATRFTVFGPTFWPLNEYEV